MKHTINISKKIKDAINKMNKDGIKCLAVIDKNKTLLGTLSDGDIRKYLVKGKPLSGPLKNIYNSQSIFFYEDRIDLKKIKKLLINFNYELVPIVNANKKIIKIITLKNISKVGFFKKKLNTFVLIMSGGKGKRLEPFTKVLPKPLVPIKDVPVIDIILENFKNFGIKKFIFSVNYKSDILKAYLNDKKNNKNFQFINEKKPLGTAGSLKYLLKNKNKNFFVSNCDVILKYDYNKIFQYHKKNKSDITLVVAKKKYILPYGNCLVSKNSEFLRIEEKPNFNFLVNTGFYIINSNILNIIPKNKFYNFDKFISDAKKLNKRIFVYKVSEKNWIDIGQWPLYKKAINSI